MRTKRFICRAVAMRVVATQHIAHHTGAFHRPSTHRAIGAAKAQTHARHGIQNAPLHRLLAVAHIGQGAALDHAQGVFQVSALGVSALSAIAVGRCTFRDVRRDQVSQQVVCITQRFRHCEERSDESISMASLRSP
jgi:hypothetical protein